MFIAALFIIARIWKKPRCPLTDEWIRKLWYTYTMEYYLPIKNNAWISFNEVDETGAYYTEWSNSERKLPIQYMSTYIWNLERWPIWETAKESEIKNRLLNSVAEGKSGVIWESITETCILPYVKQIASPGLMHETGCSGLEHCDDPEGWGGWWEGSSGWGTWVHPWRIHVNLWQKPLPYCKVSSFQLK